MSFLVLQSSCWGIESCFALVFLMPCDCYHSLSFPQGAVGVSAECDYDISWSYSLTHDIIEDCVFYVFRIFFFSMFEACFIIPNYRDDPFQR